MSETANPSSAQWSELKDSGAAVVPEPVYMYEISAGVYGFTTEPGTAVIMQSSGTGDNLVVATGSP